jgi:hypothetical protein
MKNHVIPAQAGIHEKPRHSREGGNPVVFCDFLYSESVIDAWIPAFAGMTKKWRA